MEYEIHHTYNLCILIIPLAVEEQTYFRINIYRDITKCDSQVRY